MTKRDWLTLGVVILIAALFATSYLMNRSTPAPAVDPNLPPEAEVTADNDPHGAPVTDPAKLSPDPGFFTGNQAVNAAVLASLRPADDQPRAETRLTRPVALRGTLVTPDQVIPDGLLVIDYQERILGGELGKRVVGTIASVGPYAADSVPAGTALVDLTGNCIYPGLIDMHNHVHYNVSDLWVPTYDVYPNRDRWPNDPRYKDWKKVRYYFSNDGMQLTTETTKYGEIRGLLCGTTMMQGYDGDNPGTYGLVRNVENEGNLFGVDRIRQTVIGVSSWYKGREAAAERAKLLDIFANPRTTRYIIHFCEGIDDRIREEYLQLKQYNLLRKEMVGIHSTGLRGSDWDDIAAAGMKVVWSPLSNLILYNRTTDIRQALASGVPLQHIAFAPDWAPSGTPGMFYEAKVVAEYNGRELDDLLTPQQIVAMMTTSPATVGGYPDFVGRLQPGLRADLTVVRRGAGDPYESLLAAPIEDIALVMVDGQPLYGSLAHYRRFDKGNDYEVFAMNGVEKAIDITDDYVPGGSQTLRELLTVLDRAFVNIRNSVPFEFRGDVDGYCRRAPLYWPRYTSYSNLMHVSLLGKGSDYEAGNRGGATSFRNTPGYRLRNQQAKDQYRALQERWRSGNRTSPRAGEGEAGY